MDEDTLVEVVRLHAILSAYNDKSDFISLARVASEVSEVCEVDLSLDDTRRALVGEGWLEVEFNPDLLQFHYTCE